MKILFTISTFDVGGSEVMAMNLAVKLKERGHDIIIFGANEKKVSKEFIAKYKSLGLQIYSIANWPFLYFISSRINKAFTYLGYNNLVASKVKLRFMQSLIKLHKIDLVCSHASYTADICKDAVKGKQIPLFIVEHGLYSLFLSQGRNDKLKPLHDVTGIIAVSEFCNNKIRNYIGGSANIKTIYNGVDLEKPHSRMQVRNHLGIQEGEITFGLVARGEPQKGWQYAIDAFLKLEGAVDKKVHLILVGGSNYVDSLKEKYGNYRGIHFIGKVSHPAYYIDAVDVGLMLSMYQTEALSLIAIEFLMLGKPVIATNVGGVSEIFQYIDDSIYKLIDLEEDGFISTSKLKNLMLSFTNEEKNLALNPSHIEPVLKRFSMETCAQAYESLFESILLKSLDESSIAQSNKNNSFTHSPSKVQKHQVIN